MHRYLNSPALNLSSRLLHTSSNLRNPYRQSSSLILKSNPLFTVRYMSSHFTRRLVVQHILTSIPVEIRSFAVIPVQSLSAYCKTDCSAVFRVERRLSLWWVVMLSLAPIVYCGLCTVDAKRSNRLLEIVRENPSTGSAIMALWSVRVASCVSVG
jgi:hypothetical protein